MFRKTIVTLDIESTDVRFVVVRGKQVVDWGSIPLSPGLVRQGSIVDRAGVGSVLDDFFREKELSRKGVIVSLPALRSALRLLSVPILKRALVDEAVRRESEKEFPVPLDELYLAYESVDTGAREQSFLALGVPRDMLDSLFDTLTRAGVQPGAMALKPLALARAINCAEALIADLEAETFDLVVIAGGIPVVMRTVIAGDDGTPGEERVRQLSDEIARTISFYNSSHRDNPLSPSVPVYLTGTLADDASLCRMVDEAIDNPVKTIPAPPGCPPDLPLSQFAVNIGLAAGRGLSMAESVHGDGFGAFANPNVLPERYQPKRMSLATGLYPVGAIGLAALLSTLWVAGAGTGSQVAALNDELTGVNRQIDNVRDAVTERTGNLGRLEALIDRVYLQRMTMSTSPATSDLSEELLLVVITLPDGIRLTSIDETASQIDLRGDADDASRVAQWAIVLERTGAFSKVSLTSLLAGDEGYPATFSISAETADT